MRGQSMATDKEVAGTGYIWPVGDILVPAT